MLLYQVLGTLRSKSAVQFQLRLLLLFTGIYHPVLFSYVVAAMVQQQHHFKVFLYDSHERCFCVCVSERVCHPEHHLDNTNLAESNPHFL